MNAGECCLFLVDIHFDAVVAVVVVVVVGDVFCRFRHVADYRCCCSCKQYGFIL